MTESPVLNLTDRAEKHLRKIVEQKQAKGFRLSVKKTGCSGYMYKPEIVSTAKESDICIQASENLTLFLDPNCVDLIKGTTIDYVSIGLGQSQLQFANPNAANECGCGESFNLKDEN